MSNDEIKILKMIHENKGIITTKQVSEEGLPRRCLGAMVQSGMICRVERGVYMLPEIWEDDLFFLQYRFSKGIFSHETALYLHEMTDRTPLQYTMTFPFGYNTGNVKKRGVVAKLSTVETYPLGIMALSSPCGNQIKTYDIERTLCDIAKTRHKADIQVIHQAMKAYAGSRNKDIAKLMDYADLLRVKPKVLSYMEILL
ncbi:MAG TPA: type IV toxin-antitoxin system AbiEi family antitoxin domain-containing protein [Sphaerochaeta sp.]|nr:type IV toxin-antitoxin system AbiEi family antitoxin domain-containing protein [Sphaerochaeta sp.]